jgi:hypothetical protein
LGLTVEFAHFFWSSAKTELCGNPGLWTLQEMFRDLFQRKGNVYDSRYDRVLANPIGKTPVARKSLLPVVQQQKVVVDGSDTDDLAFAHIQFSRFWVSSDALISPEWIAVRLMHQVNGAANFLFISF